MREYREKRIAEMEHQARKTLYGELLHLPASEYAREINQAPAGVWVVLALRCAGKLCDRLVEALCGAARRHPRVKFVCMVATACIPNYPEANCPTILLYRSDELLGQFTGPRSVGLVGTDSAADERAVLSALANVIDFESLEPRPTCSSAPSGSGRAPHSAASDAARSANVEALAFPLGARSR